MLYAVVCVFSIFRMIGNHFEFVAPHVDEKMVHGAQFMGFLMWFWVFNIAYWDGKRTLLVRIILFL